MNNKTSLNSDKEKSEAMSSLWGYTGCSVNMARNREEILHVKTKQIIYFKPSPNLQNNNNGNVTQFSMA